MTDQDAFADVPTDERVSLTSALYSRAHVDSGGRIGSGWNTGVVPVSLCGRHLKAADIRETAWGLVPVGKRCQQCAVRLPKEGR